MPDITEEIGGIYHERDHNPDIIEYPVKVVGYKYGEKWYEGELFLNIEILGELNPNSPDNHLGKNRLVFCNFVTMGNVYLFNSNRKQFWEDKIVLSF
mgnify:CR=1 FL=1